VLMSCDEDAINDVACMGDIVYLTKAADPVTKRLEFLLQQSMSLGTRNVVLRSISVPSRP
jgi:hypothetical protein